ncbi:response regulator [Sulfurovum sp. ST-21]|uniref:Sensory/regulatory protein RpfC n=1 Tax=Sulfurovum indicum TaxID=2779528 RepID=A0A7M1S3E6_9BACT|nr:response regulator [Sulfurovum indicum]QOR61957.1 response regulator [Sulfurovum indicum]
MNRLLKRQLKHVYGKEFDINMFDEKMRQLLQRIDEAYEENDKEKRRLDHIIQLNSEELMQAYTTIEEHNISLKDEVYEKNMLLQQYKDAIDATLIVSKTDPKGIITYVNDIFCKLSGYSREELLGHSHSIIRSPDMKAEFFTDMWETIQQKKIWHGIIKNRAKNGESYYVDATIFPLVSTKGEILEYIAIRHDITARILTEKKLEREHRYSQYLFNEQENIVLIIDEHKGVLNANRNFLEIQGYTSLDDYKKRHHCVCELFVEKEGYLHPKTSRHWTREVLEHPEKQHKAIMTNKNGEDRIYTVRVKQINFDENDLIIASFTDISELELARKLAEDSEKAKTQFMANVSHEIRTPMNGIVGFTKLLLNTKLNTKQRQYVDIIENSTHTLLEIINDVLDFSKIKSGHLVLDLLDINPFIELRNAITIFSSKAREKNISFQVNIDSSIKECIKVDKLRITQILGNLISNAIKFTPEGGVISVDLSHHSMVGDKEVILFSVSDTGIGIPADRIDKIFHSFIQADTSTTRNFGGTGLGLSISASLCDLMGTKLEVESVEGKGSRFFFKLEAEVCDSIKTLAKQVQNPPIFVLRHEKKIFHDVIHQLNNFGVIYRALTFEELISEVDDEDHLVISFNYRQYKPLSTIAKKIILIDDSPEAQELAKKELDIFHISSFEECPSELYNAILEQNLMRHVNVENTNKIQFDLSVLVAEDYETNRILIEEMLQNYGIAADFALNGFEAVEKTLHKTYDIIFMDINMPVMNGVDATRNIRERNIDTPVIALTANALEGDKEYYLSQGMNGYISKPIDIEELYAILEEFAGKKNITDLKTIEEKKQEQQEDKIEQQQEEIIHAIMESKERMHFSVSIMRRLFESFLTSAYTDVEDLVAAAEKNDIALIKIKAHGIRGSAMSLNFTEIGEMCRLLEFGEKIEQKIDYLSLAMELKEKIMDIYNIKNSILAKLAELD